MSGGEEAIEEAGQDDGLGSNHYEDHDGSEEEDHPSSPGENRAC